MMKTQSEHERETLGAFLRRTREERGLTFEQVVDSTKISPNCMKALEEDDYDNLPADAFVRGFYGIYARYLSLDPDEIRDRYNQQKKQQPKTDESSSPTPGELAMQTSSMAEPPSVTSHSVVGLSLLALIIAGIAACWYFSFNPATYLSQTLRGDKAPSTTVGEPAASPPATPDQPPAASSTLTPSPAPEAAGTDVSAPQYPSQGNIASTQTTLPATAPPSSPMGSEQAGSAGGRTAPPPVMAPEAANPTSPPVSTTYTLRAAFKEATRLTVKIDDQPAEHFNFTAGAVHSWNAGTSIVITLPAGSGTELTLNNLPLTLPKKTAGEEITVTIPQNLSE
jgi:cytoskeletal protein RodZ